MGRKSSVSSDAGSNDQEGLVKVLQQVHESNNIGLAFGRDGWLCKLMVYVWLLFMCRRSIG